MVVAAGRTEMFATAGIEVTGAALDVVGSGTGSGLADGFAQAPVSSSRNSPPLAATGATNAFRWATPSRVGVTRPIPQVESPERPRAGPPR